MSRLALYIIDDDPQSVSLLTEYADHVDMDVHAFNSGEKFFQQVEPNTENGILILDLYMPEMDGIEVLNELVKKGPVLPIILITGNDTSSLRSASMLARAYSLDIIASIVKPIRLDYFKNIIEEYLQEQSISQ